MFLLKFSAPKKIPLNEVTLLISHVLTPAELKLFDIWNILVILFTELGNQSGTSKGLVFKFSKNFFTPKSPQVTILSNVALLERTRSDILGLFAICCSTI